MEIKIYHLRNEQDKICYVGSTKTALQKRLIDHRYKKKHRKNYTIELIEEVPIEQRYIFEQYYIDFYREIIGYELENEKGCIPIGKSYYSEYYQVNKEARRKYYQENKDNNKEARYEYQKMYRDNNKEARRKWYQVNKESLSEYKKKWYQAKKLLDEQK